jgi:signal peptidase II
MQKKFYLLVLMIVAADHLSKWIVWLKLDREIPVVLIPGFLRFSFASNTGVAFGLFAGNDSPWRPYLLAGTALIALIALFLYVRRMQRRTLLQWAASLTMGGILGNFIDRVFRGFVIDFIEFHIHESYSWPNFNVADSCITIGIGLLLIDTIRNPAPNEVAEQEQPST